MLNISPVTETVLYLNPILCIHGRGLSSPRTIKDLTQVSFISSASLETK